MGYLGGGILLALNLAFFIFSEDIGVPGDLAVRINLASAGIWWMGFAFITWARLRPRHATHPLPQGETYVSVGFKQLGKTFREIKHFPETLKYLLAYFLYNDGIQTVINMATIYGAEELRFGPQVLMVTLLVIQVIASLGALLFGKLAERIGSKHAIMVSLALWSGVVIYAYFIHTALEFFVLGGIVGLVVGGSQALSRSMYGSMIPESASAEFFGFYTVFSKFSAIWGPLVFATIRQISGTARLSIVSLIFFFLGGLILLHFVDVEKARQTREAGAF